MKRIIDIIVALFLLAILFLPMIMIGIFVRFTSPGPSLFWSKRVGLNNTYFYMPKFRSMRIEAPNIATHKLKEPDKYITKFGAFIRKTSLDEIPQLISVLKGDMSLVGPRPALYNQYDLISRRTKLNISSITPGITGWAQINGRDDLTISKKVDLDYFYLLNRSTIMDLKIIFLTVKYAFKSKGIKH